jgi:hypothetical protein
VQQGNTWDFSLDGGAAKAGDKAGKKDKKDESTALGDNNPWSAGNKSKKKTTTTSFGFDFGDLDGNKDSNGIDVGDTKTTDDAWVRFALVGRQTKNPTALPTYLDLESDRFLLCEVLC